MASKNRSTSDLIAFMQALREDPTRYGFYSVLRQLECLHPQLPRIGSSLHIKDDVLRLAQEPSMAFATSTLVSCKSNEGFPDRLSVNFFGLFGPNGALPLHLTEYTRDRIRNVKDPTFKRFADIFHHRMLSFFYRSWANTQPTVNYDRMEDDRYALYVGAMFGLASHANDYIDDPSSYAMLFYAGQFGACNRHAEGLKQVLNDYFKLPVVVEEFIGQWLRIPNEHWWRLGRSRDTGMLGENTTIGERVWECQQKFRIIVGPLNLEQYKSMLPSGKLLRRFVKLVRYYAGGNIDWDIQCILMHNEVPGTILGVQGELGWTTWQFCEPYERDAKDMIMNPMGYDLESDGREPA